LRFSKLTIRNFRSIDSPGLEVHFRADHNLAALVGANGSGKSNIIVALGIVLGIYPFNRFEADETDFHDKKTDQELSIELYFSSPLVERDVYQQKYEIHGFRFRSWRKTRGDGKGVLGQEHYCFGGDRKTIVKSNRIYKKPSEKDPDPSNAMRPVLVQDHAWKIGRAFYLDAPGLERFFDKTTGWTPLGRLFELYRDDFPAEHNQHPLDGENKQPSRVAFERCAKEMASVLRTAKLRQIEDGLSSHVASYLGIGASNPLSVQLAPPTHRELFEEIVGLEVSEGKGAPSLPADRLGSGHRALLRLATIETLLELQDTKDPLIILIEEPEIYLHVHLQRYFADILMKVAAQGHQVIFATHSPEFVNLARAHEIVRLGKDIGGSSSARQIAGTTSFGFTSIKRKLQRLGNEELFFSSHAILTEGIDDQSVVGLLFQKLGLDLNVHSISVINCDGANNISDYVMLCNQLGIDFYVIHDEDDEKQHEKRNHRIEVTVTAAKPKYPSLRRYAPYLEAVVGEEKHCGIERLLSILNGKTYEQIGKEFPGLLIPIDEFASTRDLIPHPLEAD
jgi:predicted ATPase